MRACKSHTCEFLVAGLEAIEVMAHRNERSIAGGDTFFAIATVARCLREHAGELVGIRRDPRTGRFQSASTGKAIG